MNQVLSKLFLSTFLCLCFRADAEHPGSFSSAKKIVEELGYFDHLKTFYYQSDFVFDDLSDIDRDSDKKETIVMPAFCGYSPTTLLLVPVTLTSGFHA